MVTQRSARAPRTPAKAKVTAAPTPESLTSLMAQVLAPPPHPAAPEHGVMVITIARAMQIRFSEKTNRHYLLGRCFEVVDVKPNGKTVDNAKIAGWEIDAGFGESVGDLITNTFDEIPGNRVNFVFALAAQPEVTKLEDRHPRGHDLAGTAITDAEGNIQYKHQLRAVLGDLLGAAPAPMPMTELNVEDEDLDDWFAAQQAESNARQERNLSAWRQLRDQAEPAK